MPSREDLETWLDAHPDDEKAFEVYGDLLLEAGEPVGELIQLQRAMLSGPRDEALVLREAELRKQLLPPALLNARAWRWRPGVLRGVEVRLTEEFDFEGFAAALQSIHGRFIQELGFAIGVADDAALEAKLRTLLSRPQVRSVKLEPLTYLQPDPSPRRPTSLLRALPPQLEQLELKSVSGVAELVQHLGEPAPLRALRRLSLTRARLEPLDLVALSRRRAHVGTDCELQIARESASFTAFEALERAWKPVRLVGSSEAALMVVSPPREAGRLLTLPSGRSSFRIGHHSNCELALPGCGLLAIHAVVDRKETACSIRSHGPPGSAFVDGRVVDVAGLAHGSTLMLGDAALVFLEQDVDAEWDKAFAKSKQGTR